MNFSGRNPTSLLLLLLADPHASSLCSCTNQLLSAPYRAYLPLSHPAAHATLPRHPPKPPTSPTHFNPCWCCCLPLFVCLLRARVLVRSLACSLVCSLARSPARSPACSFARSPASSLARLLACLYEELCFYCLYCCLLLLLCLASDNV